MVSGFNVAQVTFMLLGGRLADRVGRRKIFLRGLAVFAIGAAASGFAPTIELVIAARIVQAIGVSLILPASLTAVLPEFPPERHASVVSWWSAMGILGAAIAPTVAAGILEVSGWRAVFLARGADRTRRADRRSTGVASRARRRARRHRSTCSGARPARSPSAG